MKIVGLILLMLSITSCYKTHQKVYKSRTQCIHYVVDICDSVVVYCDQFEAINSIDLMFIKSRVLEVGEQCNAND